MYNVDNTVYPRHHFPSQTLTSSGYIWPLYMPTHKKKNVYSFIPNNEISGVHVNNTLFSLFLVLV